MGNKTMYTPCTSHTTTLAVERGLEEALYIHEAILNTGKKVESLQFFDTKSVVTLGHPLEQPNTLVIELVKISEGEPFFFIYSNYLSRNGAVAEAIIPSKRTSPFS